MVNKFRIIKSSLMFITIVAGLLLVLSFALTDLVEKTEKLHAVEQLVSLDRYFQGQLAAFQKVAKSWSVKSELDAIIRKNTLAGRKNLFNPAKFSQSSVHFISVYDESKKPVISRAFSAESRKFSRLNTKLMYLLSKDSFLEFMSAERSRSAYLNADKLYLISSSSVQKKEGTDYIDGFMIIGREINESDIEADNLINIELEIIDASKKTGLNTSSKEPKTKYIDTTKGTERFSGLVVDGLNQTPAFIVSIKREQVSLEKVLQSGWQSLLLLLGFVFLSAYLLWWNHERRLMIKIKGLERDVKNVRTGSELSSRVSAADRGVLEGLVTVLNQKIGGFEQSYVENRKHDAEIVLNELPLEAYLKDTALKYITVNQKYSESLGFDKVDIIGKSDAELMAAESAEVISKKERRVIEFCKPVTYEEVIETDDHEQVFYTTQLIPFLNAKKQVEGVVGVRIDITDRKLAEEEMEMASKVLENTAEGVMVTDAARHIIHVNKAYSEMTGYAERELIGKVPLLLQTESRSKTYQEIQHCLQQDGVWKGELWSSRKDGTSYPEMINLKSIKNKKGDVTNYFSMSKDITDQKKWQEQLYKMAHYDSLTGLPNRTLFKDRLGQEINRCMRNKKNAAVLFIDLDLFKSINDSLGHAAGDTLLKNISERLKPTLRNADSIARMGGDEFTILVTDLAIDYQKNIGYLTRLCEKIIDVVKQPMELEGRQLNITCSIGVAVYPIDADQDEDLLRNADSAMYFAKSQGRRNYQFYSKEFNEKAVEKLEKEIEFREALKNGALQLYYQPQIDVISRRVVGAEALLRWYKDGNIVLRPDRVVALAEETGLIYELGNWILREACSEAQKWMLAGHKNLRVAVNLSPRQFRQKDLVNIVDNILQQTGLPARLLELEVTESALMENIDYSIGMMADLTRKGIRWSLDDFGTGYSSLNYLREFPVHVLKIDQSFVREISVNPEDSAIVGTIIDLAHKLHLTVIAEGVENEDQLKVLGSMSCELVQGYYFSKPIPADEFSKFISKEVL
ncbi:MAG: EAL domain-containing protein [Gammaproteobacteria bacterium]|nr:EAL domain-containing protein [Gammaproteobacteria bacterium]